MAGERGDLARGPLPLVRGAALAGRSSRSCSAGSASSSATPEVVVRTRARARLAPSSAPTRRVRCRRSPGCCGSRLEPDVESRSLDRRAPRTTSGAATPPGSRHWRAQRPVVLAIEDLHWAHASTRELAEDLLDAHRPRPAPAGRDAPARSGLRGLAIPDTRARRVLAPGHRAHARAAARRRPLSRAARDAAPGRRRRRDARARSSRARRATRSTSRSSCGRCSKAGASSRSTAPGRRPSSRRSCFRPRSRTSSSRASIASPKARAGWRRSPPSIGREFPVRGARARRGRGRSRRSRRPPARRDRARAPALPGAPVRVQARAAPGGGALDADAGDASRALRARGGRHSRSCTRTRSTTTWSGSPTTTRRAAICRRRSSTSSAQPSGRPSSAPIRVPPSSRSAPAGWRGISATELAENGLLLADGCEVEAVDGVVDEAADAFRDERAGLGVQEGAQGGLLRIRSTSRSAQALRRASPVRRFAASIRALMRGSSRLAPPRLPSHGRAAGRRSRPDRRSRPPSRRARGRRAPRGSRPSRPATLMSKYLTSRSMPICFRLKTSTWASATPDGLLFA